MRGTWPGRAAEANHLAGLPGGPAAGRPVLTDDPGIDAFDAAAKAQDDSVTFLGVGDMLLVDGAGHLLIKAIAPGQMATHPYGVGGHRGAGMTTLVTGIVHGRVRSMPAHL